MQWGIILIVAIVAVTAEQKSGRNRIDADAILTKRHRELVQLQRTIKLREHTIAELAAKERTEERAITLLRTHIEQQRRYQRLLEQELNQLTTHEEKLQQMSRGYIRALGHDYEQLQRFVLLLVSADMRGDGQAQIDTAVLGIALRRLSQRLDRTRQEYDSTNRVIEQLQRYHAMRQLLLAQKLREQQRMEKMLRLRTQLLDRLRNDRSAIEKDLRRLQNSMKTIERQIARLSRTATKTIPLSGDGTVLGVKLQPPVQGAVLRGYGQYHHPLTGARAFNHGIDIAVPVGTSIHTAAAGRVVSVQWLPAMNNVVIVEHERNIRTVYANIDRVLVKQGQPVSSGAVIGFSGETLGGAFVHFEVWEGVKRIDPSFVLR